MTSGDSLYSELKPDIQAVAEPLFEFSRICLRTRGNFLPYAAVLTDQGEVKLFAAAPDMGSDYTNSAEVLPLLHEGLRTHAKATAIRAIGVAENVTVTLEGQGPTMAVKALCEHARGFTVALYSPFEKQLLRGYVFGATVAVPAEPRVRAWT